MTELLSKTFKDRIDSTENIAFLQIELRVIDRILGETEDVKVQDEIRMKREYIQSRIANLEKRRTVRIEVDISGRLELVDLSNNRSDIKCRVRNISIGGAMIEIISTAYPLSLRNIRIHFKLEERGKEISTLCEIVHEATNQSLPAYRKLNVKFLTLLDADKAEIESWINKRLKGLNT